jgi:hypothetical protein
MSNSSRSVLDSILDLLRALFGTKPPVPPSPAPPAPTPLPDEPPSSNAPQPISSRVLVIVYDPVVEPATGLKLSQKMNWNRADDLISQYIADMTESSGGLAHYSVVKRIDVNEFPLKKDGFRYTADTLIGVINRRVTAHNPDLVNYASILAQFNIIQGVANNEFDEVWVFAFPFAGFYESVMGGAGAFWCNSNPLGSLASTGKRFIIMGFTLERGVGEMFEAFTHRCESIMTRVYRQASGEDNMFARFIRYDKVAPGNSECGNVHFAPNSERDYDWGNPRTVISKCDDWFNYPNFKGITREVTCAEWGNGDIRLHHKWWLKHLPHVGGRTKGVSNNWWQYVIDPNKVG